jgi:hypothetical protein
MAGDLSAALRKLAEQQRQQDVPARKEASPIPDSAGKAPNGVPKSSGAGGGDLTEPSYAARQYYPRQTLRSTDGVLTFQFDPIKTVVMADANSAPVIWTFAEPTA